MNAFSILVRPMTGIHALFSAMRTTSVRLLHLQSSHARGVSFHFGLYLPVPLHVSRVTCTLPIVLRVYPAERAVPSVLFCEQMLVDVLERSIAMI
jgi:hypothetical protein